MDQGSELSFVDQRLGGGEYLSMMRASFARDQRIQRKHTGIRSRTKRKGREAMRAPTEDTHHMTVITFGSFERSVQPRSADGVEDDVEPLVLGMQAYVFFYRKFG